jgi:hypothetical protein
VIPKEVGSISKLKHSTWSHSEYPSAQKLSGDFPEGAEMPGMFV